MMSPRTALERKSPSFRYYASVLPVLETIISKQ